MQILANDYEKELKKIYEKNGKVSLIHRRDQHHLLIEFPTEMDYTAYFLCTTVTGDKLLRLYNDKHFFSIHKVIFATQ